jgi:hypothetical protein
MAFMGTRQARTATLPPGAGCAAVMYGAKGSRAVAIPGGFVVGLFALGGAIGWSRGNQRDAVIGLGGALVAAGIFTALGALVGRQRLVVDGRLIWVRVGRWRGPIDLDEVIAVHWFLTRGGSGLILVQPAAGTRVGAASAIATFGTVRPARYRGTVHSGQYRYVTLPRWMLRPETLRLLAPPLLRRSDLVIDPMARETLRNAVSGGRTAADRSA